MTPGPGPTGPKPTGPGNATPGNPRPVGTPRPKAPTAALAARAFALIAVGLVLIVAVFTAPTPPPAQPLRLHWRPATAADERAYEQQQRQIERQELIDALKDLRKQRDGVTAPHAP